MTTVGTGRDHDHLPHSGMFDLPRGRPEAAEEFAVPLRPESVSRWSTLLSWFFPDWYTGFVWLIGSFVFLGIFAFALILVIPPHAVDPAAVQTTLFFAALGLGVLVYAGVLAIEAIWAWKQTRAEGRRAYLRRIRTLK